MLAPTRYNASIRNSRMDSRRLEAYLHAVLHNNDSRLILNTDRIRVSNIMRLGGGLINDVYSLLLNYTERDEDRKAPSCHKDF